MFQRLVCFSVLAVMAAPAAFASTTDNVGIMAAQKFAAAYTGNPNENVDGRLGGALANVAGCEIGKFMKEGGMEMASELLVKQIAKRTGVSEETARKGAEFAMKTGKAKERLEQALKDNCDEAEMVKKYDQPGRMDTILGRGVTRENVAVGKKIFNELVPVLYASGEAISKGDFDTVIKSIAGEGTRLYEVIKSIGKVDMSNPESQAYAAMAAGLSNSDLLGTLEMKRDEYKMACEPNRAYGLRKKAKSVMNTASNVIEMTTSPVETMIEIVVEKIMQGDSESMARLMKDENVAITKYDEEAHEHLQHEKQDAACMKAIGNLELTLRVVRGRAQGTNVAMTPAMVRELKLDEKMLYAPEKFLR